MPGDTSPSVLMLNIVLIYEFGHYFDWLWKTAILAVADGYRLAFDRNVGEITKFASCLRGGDNYEQGISQS